MNGKRIARITDQCVACGCCVKVCPMGAIQVAFGIKAVVSEKRCVGCGKCVKECPASVINLVERGEETA